MSDASLPNLLVLGRSGQLARALGALTGAPALGRPGLDLADKRAVRDAIERARPDWVINAAAYTQVDAAETDADAAFAVNAAGAEAAARAARAVGAGFIQISTDYVFDGAKGAPYTEDDAPNPQGVYARSKHAGEGAVMDAHPGALVVRTSGVFDESGPNFVTAVARRLRETGAAEVVSDQRLNPTYALDLARALVALIAADPAPGVYHAAGGDAASWFEVAEAIAAQLREAGHEARVTPTTTQAWGAPAPRPADSRLSCGKLAALGIKLPGYHAGLERAVAVTLSA